MLHCTVSKWPCATPADDVVAELSFGFWVSFVSSTYDRSLWVPYLHKAFPFYRGPRWRLHDDLHTVLLFRNRIMHYERSTIATSKPTIGRFFAF